MIKPQMIISFVGTWLVVTGIFVIYATRPQPAIQQLQLRGGSQLQVVPDGVDQSDASSFTDLQGADGLQSQRRSPQVPVSTQLQPNAGASNLPANY